MYNNFQDNLEDQRSGPTILWSVVKLSIEAWFGLVKGNIWGSLNFCEHPEDRNAVPMVGMPRSSWSRALLFSEDILHQLKWWVSLEMLPLPTKVTTRIITFSIEDFCQPAFLSVTGRGNINHKSSPLFPESCTSQVVSRISELSTSFGAHQLSVCGILMDLTKGRQSVRS